MPTPKPRTATPSPAPMEPQPKMEQLYTNQLKDFAEAGLCGTAAVISPVSVLGYKGQDRVISGGKIGEFAQKLYDYIDDLHTGKAEDVYGFIDVAGQY